MAEDTEAPPCVVCGTTGGYTPARTSRPTRSRGACHTCYKRLWRSGRLDELDRVSLDTEAFLTRLLAGEVEPDEGGCILWPGNTSRGGYGIVVRGGVRVKVTHLVLEASVGPRPSPDHVAAHALHEVCGNRHCVNIEHLRWATQAENQRDRVLDGTKGGIYQ